MLPPMLASSSSTMTVRSFLCVLLALSAATRPATAATPQPASDVIPALAVLPPGLLPEDGTFLGSPKPLPLKEHNFKLKHVFHHGTYQYPEMHRRLDVPESVSLSVIEDEDLPHIHSAAPELRIRSQSMKIERLADRSPARINALLDSGRMMGQAVSLQKSDWTIDDVNGPNITDKETVLSMARIAANAYVTEPHSGDWVDIGHGFNYTEDFGWESDGLRGHIFVDTENKTAIIGVKGTSPAVFDGSETTTNDKVNDNLFFSCCCAQGGQFLWHQVCDCRTSTYTCNSTCLVTALNKKNRYYYAVQDLYHNVTALYPEADVWMAGHSLGGAVSSLLALTYGLPAVTFEAVPEAMPAARLGLPTPPGYQLGYHQQRMHTGVYHFGHTADPIYMGSCNAATSACTLGGYALESQCHAGHICTYDTVNDKGWRVGIGTHKIASVIKDVIERYDGVPNCTLRTDCTDCFNWEYYESNGTDPSTTRTSTSASATRTRTSTCKTPGWWGCLDESTTTGSTSSSSVPLTTITTTTCLNPGWFGCKEDPVNTTITTTAAAVPTPSLTHTPTSTSISASISTTSTCKTPGWFGCEDPTSTVPSTTSSAKLTSATNTKHKHKTTCTSKEWFGLICVDPSPDESPWTMAPTATAELEL
ncbi:hypothetical protein LTS18_009460 [Coniosporium uncinatum]|uniref:Uncharacterized protein n=1 Tax=Coniosporium uncinatum TaxID=93489 RepID=A0ACC3DMA3_9PEZI|nr:hypothetical protein LTS18_009460 [Coniosporium uncinatum]